MSIDFIHDCTLVLYRQLFKTGFDCYPSYFPLSFAIEVGFGANATRSLGPISVRNQLDSAALMLHFYHKEMLSLTFQMIQSDKYY